MRENIEDQSAAVSERGPSQPRPIEVVFEWTCWVSGFDSELLWISCGNKLGQRQADPKIEKGRVLLPGVKLKENESFEGAMKRFKKQCEKAGLMYELRKREYYEKPSVRRKRKTLAARKRALKKLKTDR